MLAKVRLSWKQQLIGESKTVLRTLLEHTLTKCLPNLDCSYSGHSMSDPGTSYRSRDEVQEVRQTRDPITSLKEKIISNDLATAEEIKALEVSIRTKVDAAQVKAKAAPEIGLDELSADIYASPVNSEKIRNVLPNQPLQHKNVVTAKNL